MSEKRFLSFVFTEGVILLLLGGLILTLPKFTEISFGFALCLTLIIYGGYKAITSFLAKNFEGHYILNIINATIILILGILMFSTSILDMTIIATVLGAYFLLAAISACAFTYQIQKVFSVWKSGYILSLIHAFFGIILILLAPTLWISGIFVGLDFILYGILLLNMYFSKMYTE